MSRFKLPNYSEISRDVLVERLTQVETENGLRFETHPRYRLTQSEQSMLGIISSRATVVSKESVYTLMYGMAFDPPEQKILDVMMCKLRKKLRPMGVAIQTVWGRGWFMEPDDRARAQAIRFQPEVAA